MKNKKIMAVLCSAFLAASMLAGCGADNSNNDNDTAAEKLLDGTAATSEEIKEAVSEKEAEEAGFDDGSEEGEAASSQAVNTDEQVTGIHHAEISVQDYGTISLELDADKAPVTVTNFIKLAQDGFYNGLTFHRIMDGFMIQGGDPLGNGTGGSDENIKGEFSSNGVENDISHTRGTISMARATDPDSASSQFFIVQADSTFLDGDYAGFGHVTEGIEIVDKICQDAQPTDDNGTIPSDAQPVIQSIVILD
ncbi:MAG: peptidylprolyl isomerase [Blautia sp.]|nr:peptidylprolyl isomerase [Blautia sp.]